MKELLLLHQFEGLLEDLEAHITDRERRAAMQRSCKDKPEEARKWENLATVSAHKVTEARTKIMELLTREVSRE